MPHASQGRQHDSNICPKPRPLSVVSRNMCYNPKLLQLTVFNCFTFELWLLPQILGSQKHLSRYLLQFLRKSNNKNATGAPVNLILNSFHVIVLHRLHSDGDICLNIHSCAGSVHWIILHSRRSWTCMLKVATVISFQVISKSHTMRHNKLHFTFIGLNYGHNKSH